MANPEHVRIVKQGAEAIAEWRKRNPRERLDLTGADLRGANLSAADLHAADLSGANLRGANLSAANLHEADLSGADLGAANLHEADLSGANLSAADLTWADFSIADLAGVNLGAANLILADLSGANLAGANLIMANLSAANLSAANLSAANLGGANLRQANLAGANLANAQCKYTVFADVDLSETKGLETVVHRGPSTVGIDTIFRSKGRIPAVFLRGCGVAENLIKVLPQILAEVRYYSSFIAYGEPDKDFAERLYKELSGRAISCWMYAMDQTPGRRTWQEIAEKRRTAERMIVLCSAAALVRDGVKKEIEEQMDEDPEKIIPISLDNLWTQPGFIVKRGERDLKPFLLERNYANFGGNNDFGQALDRLLRALEKRAKPPAPA